MIQTIITAAGHSLAEFASAGFAIPKSLVKIHSEFILSRAIRSYARFPERTWVALNMEENTQFQIGYKVSQQFPDISIIDINSDARGALVSALLASGGLNLHQPLVVAGGDSELRPSAYRELDTLVASGATAGTICFEAEGRRWSYVDVAPNGRVREVSEKHRLGSLASSGVFFFQRAEFFLNASRWVLLNNAVTEGRFFVSATLNKLISEGLSVQYVTVDASRYHSYATPDLVRKYVE